MPPLEFKQRVRLPDALPEVSTALPHGRRRRGILLSGAVAWTVATAIGWMLLDEHWGTPPRAQSYPDAVSRVVPESQPLPAEVQTPPPARALPAASHSSGNIEPRALLPDCEQALAATKAELTQSDWALPRDMTGTDYGALLDGPSARAALKQCASSRAYRIELCVTVLGTRAIGVTASAEPENAAVSACVNRAVGNMRFSYQPQPQLFRSRITL